jgi:deoxyribose-phosphate aldolase
VRIVALTTLDGANTPGKVAGLRAKARQPDPTEPTVPPVTAVCVYPDPAAVVRRELAGSAVAVASGATAFPSGRAPLAVNLAMSQRPWKRTQTRWTWPAAGPRS